jgi:acetyl esterase/lipase
MTSREPTEPADSVASAIHVSDLTVPPSDFASRSANRLLSEMRARRPAYYAAIENSDIAAIRELWDRDETQPALEKARALFPVAVESSVIGGVKAEIVTPVGGVAPENRNRILINLHGGGFIAGAGPRALLEAVPIASVGRIAVATLDYRLSPEHVFPAASKDIAAAYRHLLGRYRPENIGIYGCSAGGTLSAEAVAWLQKEYLPRPGAIAMICSNAARMGLGDSTHLAPALGISVPRAPKLRWYFDGTDPKDPLVSPCASPQVLQGFPPTLLISATRDFFLSHTTHFHLQLLKAGIEAQLCIWDGLWHGFVWWPELPESSDAYRIIVDFFRRHLGQQ